MRIVMQKAEEIVRTGAYLYRELALSALRLVPGRS